MSVDADDNVWVGGYPGGGPLEAGEGSPSWFYRLDKDTVAELDSFDASSIGPADEDGCGGFGGLVDLVDDKEILWSASPNQNSLLRYDIDAGTGTCIPVPNSYGLAVDSRDFIWNSMGFNSTIAKISSDGLPSEASFLVPGFGAATGVAVTPREDDVWVAQSFDYKVVRLDNNGNSLSAINVGSNPTGIAVDFYGYVWVTNLDDNNVVRINPDEDIVDFRVILDDGSDPDNYSNMTGAVAPLGTWTVIHELPSDSSQAAVSWTSEEPAGTGLTVEVRSAVTEKDLEYQDYVEVEEEDNDVAFDLNGPVIQVRVTFQPNDETEGISPVLYDLTVKSAEPEPEGLVCDINDDEVIDIFDILGIFFTIGDSAKEPFDPRDWDDSGTITIIDARGCVLECTNAYCAPEKKLH